MIAIVALWACGSEPAPAPVQAASPAAAQRTEAPAPEPPRGCPPGVALAPGWPGEYPEPVVEIVRPITTPGRTQACDPQSTTPCTLPAGLYHPWAKTQAHYATLRAVERYEVATAHTLGSESVTPGTVVEMLQYIGEGFCLFAIGDRHTQADCPDQIEKRSPGTLKALAGVERAPENWFRVQCTEGHSGWIHASEALLAIEGVRRGKTTGYGEVAGAESISRP
ncbi:MAG: hypothetical protein KTR31_14630 [Myxococcales bacterium]|nr:hypothetical protein [Myxococcales bacterium]